MKSNMAKSVFLKQKLKVCRNIFRLIGNAKVIHPNVIAFFITVSTKQAAILLPLLHPQQQLAVLRNQRHRSTASSVLGAILTNDSGLAIFSGLSYRMGDCENIFLKINILPAQT